MLEAEELSSVELKRPSLSPKALIHQKFGNQASYRIEEVRQPVENSCPGLALAQQTRSLFRCYLDLPELSVISDPLPKKKDAEHAAAKIAIEKLGIQSKVDNPTPREAMDELVVRLAGFFTDEFFSSTHPLVGHIKAALRRVGEHFGMLPMSAIATCDTKVNNLCKVINPMAESDPMLVLSLISRAAKMSSSICVTCGELWIWKPGSYPTEFFESVKNLTSVSAQNTYVEALLIPYLLDRDVETLTLKFSDSLYYMDEIAQKLHVRDPSRIVVSRTVGKASSEMRLYFSAPDIPFFTSDLSMEVFPMIEGNVNLEKILNERASYLSGQHIYGNAIMAHVGYRWKSSDIFYEDISLSTYYRMILGKLPDGHYKLSREAILSAELPTVYTTRSNWKGPTPRDLLSVFCRQNRLSEPLFSIKILDYTETSVESSVVKKKLSRSADEVGKVNGDKYDPICRELGRSISAFKCEVQILSKRQDTVVKCSFDDICRKECDAIQSAALKVLSCLNKLFKRPDLPLENFLEFECGHNIVVNSAEFIQELVKYPSVCDIERKNKCSVSPLSSNQHSTQYENGMSYFKIDGPDSGIFPSPGSVTCISYVAILMKKDTTLKEVLESKDVFEFEIGTGAVISELESCVSQLTVNQSAQFVVEAPSRDLIFSAAGQVAKHLSQLSLDNCFLEYSVKLLHVTEPLEDRIEQALFSPPLSKQRVEFAVGCINQLHATSLVDFGCGSGSLLDSLLDHSTTLEKVAGVDISRKSLIRAAKILHTKLSASPSRQKNIRSAILYDGSITGFDSRLREFDIGTCLEVIEHMEEDQACLFGDVVLSFFCPGVLIVSTPNYEYNPILQKSTMPGKEDDSEDKPTSSKFRNHDHKFEWTRQQFQCWANNLATRHHYRVEFSGVGGSADVEPGFASQIAVFKRASNLLEKKCLIAEPSEPYEVIWEWSSDSASL